MSGCFILRISAGAIYGFPQLTGINLKGIFSRTKHPYHLPNANPPKTNAMKNILKLCTTLAICFSSLSNLNAQVIQINQTFSSDTIITPFTGSEPIYSLSMSGGINLLSDSSLVRVVLIDIYGNHYLVFESYPLITLENAFDTISASDETTFLDGVICDSLRIDIINAFLDLDSLKLDTGYIPNGTALRAQAKWEHDSVKIAIMNQRIVEEHMYWRAGRTRMVEMAFYEKEKYFWEKYNLVGFDYYIGGIFEVLGKRIQGTIVSSYVPEFNWRYRHSASTPGSPYFDGDSEDETGWLSPIEDQGPCNNSCWVHAATHTFADRINIYCNNPLFNYNFSEWEIHCESTCNPCGSIGSAPCALAYIMIHSINEEDNCPTYGSDCSGSCTGIEQYSFSGKAAVVYSTFEEIQEAIILNGPLSSGLYYPYHPYATPGLSHAMVLIGYHTAKAYDTVYRPKSPEESYIIVEPDSPLEGQIWFDFKNSDQNIHFWSAWSPLSGLRPPEKLTGNVTSTNPATNFTPLCRDEDGDGYYWWGIGPKPDNCPGDAAQEDCDDSDIHKGPYNLEQSNGPLYECTDNPCETDVSSYEEITSTPPPWTGIIHKTKNIIIRENATLEIQGELFLTPGVKIIVEPGALLKLHSTNQDMPAKISSGCGEFWKGIQIWGDPTLPQTGLNQGKVQITNGIIENAACGIMTGNPDYTPDGGGQWEPYPVYPSGGIIIATFATFRNNKTDVRFYPYRDYDGYGNPKANVSVFKECSFETTEELLNTSEPDYHVRLDGVHEVVFQGCTFTNSRDNSVLFPNRGIGVYSYNSQVRFEKTIISGTACTFEKLKYGIYSMYSGLGSASLTLDECELSGNQFGIYASGYTQIAPITINSCTVNIDQNFGASEFYGVYLNNCTGFDVRQNYFSASSLLSNTYGVIVNNSGTDNNYIYDNYFEHLTYGLQGLNINRNSDAAIEGGVPVFIPTGLRFICNKFHDVGCSNDFLINEDLAYPLTQPGIAYYQRNASNITEPTQEPAGNTFTPSHGNLTDNVYDINISETVAGILYTHHTLFPFGLRLIPDDVSNPDKVVYEAFSLEPYSESTSCPDDFYPEGTRIDLQSAISEAGQKIDSLVSLLQFLVDDGSTDTLRSTVENSTSSQSYDVYQNLLNASPYLSDTVLKTSIEKEDVLLNVMIRDIMIANPQSAKSEELLTTLDERTDPMPDSMWVEILQGMDTVGAMERLVSELAGWMQRSDLYFNALAELFLNDTINPWASDSLVNLLESDGRLSSGYLLTQYYLDHFNVSEANNVLQDIPSEFSMSERQWMTHNEVLSLVNLFPQLFNDTVGFLVPDSAQAPALVQLADADYNLPGAWARNILVASGLLDYQEPIVSETTLKSSRRGRFHWTRSRSFTPNMKVFPNPARDFVIVEYHKNDMLDQAILEVLDMKGRKVRSYFLPKTANQQIISFEGLSVGTYLIQIYVNGLPKESCKVVIIR